LISLTVRIPPIAVLSKKQRKKNGSTSSDKTIKLWDAQTGQCLMTMANLPDNETASWSETELTLLSASPNAWRWIGLADGCRRLPIELLADPAGK